MIAARARGWRLAIHETLSSTSDACRARAAGGEPGALAVLARRQTQGRGTDGRTWQSPPGNLYLSVLLRPAEPARLAGEWSLLAAVALAETVALLLPDRQALTLKWPNDLLLHGGKLAGILTESAAAPGGTLDFVIIGFGLNLAVAPTLPDRRTACLADAVAPPGPEDFAWSLLDQLDRWRLRRLERGFAAVREAWMARGPLPGAPIAVRQGTATLHGSFAGLGADGSLLLSTGTGVRKLAAGEVLAVPPGGG